ncbi:iron complex transport system substrate-binding protein [Halopseudomonas sabulinigri]|uniref:Iron complex transport system substrate-binding protein n=1 Tax=Halopseudomonas sabulinigri TaxID=472181 RepID=A0A1H1UGE6_9GAMM|nr:iron complex transport system substrate-binding protein [Halopseudomonas sabulinigri]
MKTSSLSSALLCLAALFAGQTLAADSREVTDAAGQTHQVPVDPQRVVALSEIDLDAALALGLKPTGAVNGRGQSSLPRYLLSRAEGVKVVGDLDNPNLEILLEQQPDLILTGPAQPEVLALLNEIAPTVVTYQWGTPWKETLTLTADVLNRQDAAEAFIQRYDARVLEAREHLAAQQGQTISIVRWNPKGPAYMFRDSFGSQVVRELGLQRPSYQQDAGHTHSQSLSLESLELLDADWLVIGTLDTSGEAVDALHQAEQTPAFQQLSAIEAKRYGAVDGSLWTSVGGPLAAMTIIDDVEQLLSKPDAEPLAR